MKEFLKKNGVGLCLVIALIGSLFYIAKLKNHIKNIETVNVVGSYATSNMAGAEYFVFTQDGTYCNYKQYDHIEDGSYEVFDNIITLKGDNEDRYIVYENSRIHYFNPKEGTLTSYDKFSKVPTYITIPAH